ncbi:DNA primase/polymerase/helicase [Arthrobacter phage Riovina]|uniref:DNA primase/polymerase/helicase n=3 Tax=Korravirus hunterdalle TaxID=1982080 RepID=A0A3G8FV74_9CAUD|nr:DNA primase/polymerase/helicase [Arthrobacter phage Aledel]AZS09190.1 DNA primase/polymerase/helicase [Arthrobacter phage OMalley]AZS09674.1 DNA primase/polymerase/helicase [Arthrobacter phage Riovina]
MVKLSERLAAELTQYTPETMLDSALALAREGWNVFPLRPGTKAPMISKKAGGNGALDGSTDEDLIRYWWNKYPTAGIGANLGDDRLAIDLDFNHGAVRLGSLPDTRTHHSGRGNGNVHLIYRVEPGSAAAGVRSGTNVLGPGIDIRAGKGSYIVMPPTPHEETGEPYTLDGFLREEHTLTDDELAVIYQEAGVSMPAASRGASKGLAVVDGTKSHKRPMESSAHTLAGLLADPPAEGGRNDWFTRVCGFVAKKVERFNDYEIQVLGHAGRMSNPLPVEELQKTLNSVWESEQAKPAKTLFDGNGFLTGNKARLFCQIATRQGDDTVYETAPYADFDLEARGVAVDESSRRLYWVRVFWNGAHYDTTLPGETLGNENGFKTWLAARGMSVDQPFNAMPKTPAATRILRYLNSQQPPEVKIVTTLGYDEAMDGFVTHEGLINQSGKISKEDAKIVADPSLVERDIAPYAYGMERDRAEAQRVLSEILTFQDETATSIFGAWWAACLLKPQIQDRTSLFPFFGVEAASESGKTNGFFDLMVELNGNTRGQIVPTRPVLRDYASANKNGIVWADDLDSLEAYGELLRASTSNGTASKMEADRNGIRNTKVVAPILITGEALGFGTQKALMDRSVILNITSPKGRRSRHDPAKLQWEDVQELRSLYPKAQGGLSVLAGWYVQHALQNVKPALKALNEAARLVPGRHGDKLAVLRAGARLLDSLVGHPDPWSGSGEHARRVDQWAGANVQTLDQDNTLTMKVLPWALRAFNYSEKPERIEMGRFQNLITPVVVKGDLESLNQPGLDGSTVEVYFSPVLLAEAWKREQGFKVDARTETQSALSQQAQALAAGHKVFKVEGKAQRYRALPKDYLTAVLSRAEGQE